MLNKLHQVFKAKLYIFSVYIAKKSFYWNCQSKKIKYYCGSNLPNSFDIIGISEYKTTKSSKKSAFNLPGYTFCFNETETFDRRTGFFVSNNLTYKLRPDLLINEHGKLEPTFIGLIFRNKKNIICGVIFKDSDMQL